MIQLSIIIPVLNEEYNLPQCLRAIPHNPNIEVIVIDGGSSDRSIQIAKHYGCTTETILGGKAKQLQKGAQKAQGNTLLFLHGDCLLPKNFDVVIEQTLHQQNVCCGAFSLAINEKGFKYTLVSWGANFRSRWSNLPYGDQGLFMRKSTYQKIGGFPSIPIMEDYVFIRNIAQLGAIMTCPEKIITSARRWKNMGVFRTTMINQAIIIGYKIGIHPENLYRLYNRLKGVGEIK